MFRYNGRVSFIDCYVNGIFNGNIGFIRQKNNESHIYIGIYLQNLPQEGIEGCKVYLQKYEGTQEATETPVSEFPILKGKGEGSCILTEELLAGCNRAVLHFVCSQRWEGFCFIDVAKKEKEEIERKTNETVPKQDEKNETQLRVDKWQQLQAVRPRFLPFKEQGYYVILAEEDWEFMPKSCRNLQNCDFYRRAYEGYRHMIVGEYITDTERAFYLGIPGIYGEREIEEAAAAGFLGYEFCGAGGYYLYYLGSGI